MPTIPDADRPAPLTFRDLKLPEPLLKSLADVGYEAPTAIQAQTIPSLLEGRDVLGMAQTGTGKTAAFALPILARIDLKQTAPQALVLAPTRELAIQVAEAFQKYAAHLRGFHVVPIYGGQSYGPQLGALRRGAHVIVGTPGRVIDHMDRGTLKLDALRFMVLDEADEMLRMGFIDDVDKILKQTPPTRQVALFSATMPSQIRRIAQTHLKSPAEITVREKTATVANTRQRYWLVSGATKLEALTRILEAEGFDGMLVFVRTKQDTIELSTRLEARGFASAPLNGDIDQRTRERTVARLKGGSLDIIVATDVAARGLDVERVSHVVNFDVPTDSESYVHRIGRTGRAGRKGGSLDIIVATDVAARGLDVERVSHVVNFDVPTDSESYVHRIGRTGRAGRKGEAILFIMPRERHMLKIIERATRQHITPMELPSAAAAQAQRLGKLKEKIAATLGDAKLAETLESLRGALTQYESEAKVSALDLAAALAYLIQGDAPSAKVPSPAKAGEGQGEGRTSFLQGEGRIKRHHESDDEKHHTIPKGLRPGKRDKGLETYRIEVGHQHGVKPGNIVGAIANEAELDAQHIGRVQIFDDYSLVDLPEGMPKEIFRHLQKVWVSGQQLKISRLRK